VKLGQIVAMHDLSSNCEQGQLLALKKDRDMDSVSVDRSMERILWL